MNGVKKTDKGLIVGFWEEPKSTSSSVVVEATERKDEEIHEVVKRKPGRPKKNL